MNVRMRGFDIVRYDRNYATRRRCDQATRLAADKTSPRPEALGRKALALDNDLTTGNGVTGADALDLYFSVHLKG
jgi:predicted alpha/beta-hydrolase family hydrolase